MNAGTEREVIVKTLILASHNLGKLEEFRAIAGDYPVRFLGLVDIGFDQDIDETGSSFDENALIKAMAVHRKASEIVVADDTGLCVDALNGAPGLYSARYAGEGKSGVDRMERLLKELDSAESPDRSAAFHCSLAVVYPDGRQELYHGFCRGSITRTPRGDNGFGYDPVFVPDGERRTFAEMSGEEKHAISHRGLAVRAFLDAFIDEEGGPPGSDQ